MAAVGTDDALELSLVNDLRNIAIAAENIDAFCARYGLAAEIAFEVNLAFDSLQAPAPDFEISLQDRAKGGLGIYLVRKTMDTVAYRRQDGRNVVTLTKRVALA